MNRLAKLILTLIDLAICFCIATYGYISSTSWIEWILYMVLTVAVMIALKIYKPRVYSAE